MNLHALRLFHHVAEQGSVTKAADQLNISQPAVTSQIKKLERELGLPLLSPLGRGILLTEAGKRLAAEAGRLFALERNIEQTIDDYIQGNAGRLLIAATYLPANFLLPASIAKYKQHYPNVEVQFTTTSSANAINLLLRYEADIAFIGGARQSHPSLDSKQWIEDEMWFVIHKNHRLASQETLLAEVIKEPIAFREKGSYSREQLLAMCQLHRLELPKVGLQLNGFSELIRVVSEGYGVAFLSALEAREEVERGDLRRIYVKDVRLTNPISLHQRKEALPAQARRFLDFVPAGL
ncbi:LysR family transcriptional regulator [Cohnella sp. NL03-T5]|nr:LysR family transcriptional regulator [Cohnella silvisoli]